MAITAQSHLVDISTTVAGLNAFLSETEINSIISVTLVEKGLLLIIYT